MYGAAPLKDSTTNFFKSKDILLFNLYGMSETTGTHIHHTDNNYKLTSSGFCTPGLDLMIYKPDDKGEGEICMRGRNIMMGYLDNEKATLETIDS
jgi:long-chain-fatty-acid--CoA ligase ACSBG